MGVTRQGAQKQLHLMVADGLVEQRPNPSHQRSPLYQLSRKGRDLYARTDRMWSARARRLASSLSAKDVQIARRVLVALRNQLVIDPKGETV
jgi:DNA-binding MarR family transcriptional regulator